ncbi:hypothetical protein C8J57DRAFT_1232663 [Mycena rebaudengoi]|nr:hypothetical protein C8J57DRAFT_1232663 [Mycena rebaudengoi]
MAKLNSGYLCSSGLVQGCKIFAEANSAATDESISRRVLQGDWVMGIKMTATIHNPRSGRVKVKSKSLRMMLWRGGLLARGPKTNRCPESAVPEHMGADKVSASMKELETGAGGTWEDLSHCAFESMSALMRRAFGELTLAAPTEARCEVGFGH